jgi:hypothetical protein
LQNIQFENIYWKKKNVDQRPSRGGGRAKKVSKFISAVRKS